MRTEDFDYRLPDELIAQSAPARGSSRLLVVSERGAQRHRRFAELPEVLRAGDLLVINDTRVLSARLFAQTRSGAPVEILLVERVAERTWEALARPGRRARTGARLQFPAGLAATVTGKVEDRYRLEFERDPEPLLETLGHVPLPPYIRRADEPADREAYQTIFAREPGAVAAPTAGLHFTPLLLQALASREVGLAAITLHVGPGTFRPVTEANPRRHRLLPERHRIPDATSQAVEQTRRSGGRVVAVGTTVVRTLEGAARCRRATDPLVPAGEGRTDLFILPGFEFRVTDLLLTNFHLPRSTLLMLVCALGGHERILDAYREAVEQRYRFYSYGDAMLVGASSANGVYPSLR